VVTPFTPPPPPTTPQPSRISCLFRARRRKSPRSARATAAAGFEPMGVVDPYAVLVEQRNNRRPRRQVGVDELSASPEKKKKKPKPQKTINTIARRQPSSTSSAITPKPPSGCHRWSIIPPPPRCRSTPVPTDRELDPGLDLLRLSE